MTAPGRCQHSPRLETTSLGSLVLPLSPSLSALQPQLPSSVFFERTKLISTPKHGPLFPQTFGRSVLPHIPISVQMFTKAFSLTNLLNPPPVSLPGIFLAFMGNYYFLPSLFMVAVPHGNGNLGKMDTLCYSLNVFSLAYIIPGTNSLIHLF